ncbi:vesicle transport protein SFT2D1 [Acrasis kona]|uniref:Vesicle transport protein n=1 Tax=Acrasis kona TaxID=1008807 RepID=A0AAW2YW60_9EUKA
MDFLNNIREQLPDSRLVGGIAYNALQTVGDNLNDIGTKIQNSQIADRIKHTIQSATDNSSERQDMARSHHVERRPLTSPISDESDDDDVRIDVSSNNSNDATGWYTDNGAKPTDNSSVFTRFSSYFKPEEPQTVPQNAPMPEPVVLQPQVSSWQDSITSSFSSVRSSIEGRINALSGEPEPQQEVGWFGSIINKIDGAVTLTSQQRMIGFFICLGIGIAFIAVAMITLPSILLMAKFFAVMYSFVASVCFLVGPVQQLKNMFVPSRAISSGVYLFSLIMTLVAALVLHSAGLVVLMLIAQFLSLAWYILSYVPFAQRIITMLFSTAGRSLF